MWKSKCLSVLKTNVLERIEGNQLDVREENKMWLVRHLVNFSVCLFVFLYVCKYVCLIVICGLFVFVSVLFVCLIVFVSVLYLCLIVFVSNLNRNLSTLT
jgi:hypothetical protein